MTRFCATEQKKAPKLKLYLLTAKICPRRGYDYYDSAVVAAKSAEAARKLFDDSSWPGGISSTCIGAAGGGMVGGEVVCASFNAG